MALASDAVEPAPTGTPSPARTRRKRWTPQAVAVGIVLWLYAAVCVLPLLTMVLNSFRTHLEIATDPWPIPSDPTVANYVGAWTEASFGRYALNSVLITICSVAISTVVSLPAAYAIARWRFFGRNALEGLFMSGLLIPFMLAILPMFYLMDGLRLIDSPLSLILIYSANGIPFTTFVLVSFFRQLPGELEEAALLDGGGHFTVFLRVMVPLVRPAIATVVVFRFVPIWNDFLMPLVMLRSRDNYTLGVGLTTFFGEYQNDWASLFAGLVITTIPLLVLFILATRQIIQGLTAGIGK
ncbi:carbohydrate ABC transporter permease [Dactylosporangium sp. AC04546]|uniref:carbohydrate ABC transporter permease n=1 Tax=Dactylosporangium sp. AC04546 TaxID=2862460 RepID=UPI001EDCDD95|nr:carbohydrate ABC transporter permease [Dactylosporangium sp. AC04546]WVK87203.1 carbohydrate ABC transporter permease [Dactylosporangium sp. AC04546]